MGLLGIGLLVVAIWGLSKLLNVTKTQQFNTTALIISLSLGLLLAALSQKGWLLFALIPLAVLLSFCVFCFWTLKNHKDKKYGSMVNIFMASVIAMYVTVPALGDGDTTLAFSVFETVQGTSAAIISSALSFAAGLIAFSSFAYLYYVSIKKV